MVDLFGRPIFDAGRVSQPSLFPDEHWFYLGYQDGWHGAAEAAPTDQERSAYAWHRGYQAAQRDQQESRGSDAGRAFRQARTVGNVTE